MMKHIVVMPQFLPYTLFILHINAMLTKGINMDCCCAPMLFFFLCAEHYSVYMIQQRIIRSIQNQHIYLWTILLAS